MSAHTNARLIRAGHRQINTEDGKPFCDVLSGAVGTEQADANEERPVLVWNAHDGLAAENAALNEQLARKDEAGNTTVDAVDLAELRGQIKGMQEAAYTFGDSSQEAVRVALDGVLDAIDELAAGAAGATP